MNDEDSQSPAQPGESGQGEEMTEDETQSREPESAQPMFYSIAFAVRIVLWSLFLAIEVLGLIPLPEGFPFTASTRLESIPVARPPSWTESWWISTLPENKG